MGRLKEIGPHIVPVIGRSMGAASDRKAGNWDFYKSLISLRGVISTHNNAALASDARGGPVDMGNGELGATSRCAEQDLA